MSANRAPLRLLAPAAPPSRAVAAAAPSGIRRSGPFPRRAAGQSPLPEYQTSCLRIILFRGQCGERVGRILQRDVDRDAGFGPETRRASASHHGTATPQNMSTSSFAHATFVTMASATNASHRGQAAQVQRCQVRNRTARDRTCHARAGRSQRNDATLAQRLLHRDGDARRLGRVAQRQRRRHGPREPSARTPYPRAGTPPRSGRRTSACISCRTPCSSAIITWSKRPSPPTVIRPSVPITSVRHSNPCAIVRDAWIVAISPVANSQVATPLSTSSNSRRPSFSAISPLANTRDGDDRAAEQPARRIDVVNAHVGEDAAARLRVADEVAARIVLVERVRAHHQRTPDMPLPDPRVRMRGSSCRSGARSRSSP